MLALVLANSPLAGAVESLLDTRLGFSWRFVDLSKPLVLWINDGLMAFFFLLVGLEIKREVVEGSLSQPSQVALPIAGAARRHGRAGRPLCRLQLERSGGAARLGDPGRHRHRLFAAACWPRSAAACRSP